MYAFDAGERAVQAHFDRIGVKAEVYKGEFLGLYRTRYIRDYDPLISIIIPNKDHTDDLERCIKSIEEKSTYRNFEYIIVRIHNHFLVNTIFLISINQTLYSFDLNNVS